MFACTLLLLIGFNGYSQDVDEVKKPKYNGPTVNHTVTMGETVMMIARKYLIKPEDIYDLNPKAVDGVSPQMVLVIRADKHQEREEKKPKKKKIAPQISNADTAGE